MNKQRIERVIEWIETKGAAFDDPALQRKASGWVRRVMVVISWIGALGILFYALASAL